MILPLIAALASAQVPADTGRVAAAPPAPAPIVAAASLLPLPADTPRARPRAVEYSDFYYTRLTVHRWGSYVMLPLFAAQYAVGQNLVNDSAPSRLMRGVHSGLAGTIGVVFGGNTLLGAWNLWDARNDPAGRTRRYVHAGMMLASDVGFMLAGATGPGDHDRGGPVRPSFELSAHRNIAIGSMALATVGSAMMLLWK